MPLSPTVAGSQQRSFGLGDSLGDSGIQLMESSLHPSTNSVSHSYSSSSLGQMIDSSSMGSFWTPHRGQMRLQSRRSQSREDLNSSLADAHMTKVQSIMFGRYVHLFLSKLHIFTQERTRQSSATSSYLLNSRHTFQHEELQLKIDSNYCYCSIYR